MMNKIVAYNQQELENLKLLSHAKKLYKSDVITLEQYETIKNKFKSNLFSPSVFVRILLFVLSLIGFSTIMGPISLILQIDSEIGIQATTFFTGLGILLFLDFGLIKQIKHFKSGVTEAALLIGTILFSVGVLGLKELNLYFYLFYGLLVSAIIAVRYLNFVALIMALASVGALVFYTLFQLGGIAEATIPFSIMLLYAIIFWSLMKFQGFTKSEVFEHQFTLSKVFCLFMFYLAGNYFVVRTLSVELMGLNLQSNQNIPFAYLFYFFTGCIPLGYLIYGITKKSILFIRVAIITMILSIVTLKIYFSLGAPVVTITLSGAIMIGLAWGLMKYLKEIKNGFTRNKLLQSNWDSTEISAFLVAHANTGNNVPLKNNDLKYGGGKFGGGGAGSDF